MKYMKVKQPVSFHHSFHDRIDLIFETLIQRHWIGSVYGFSSVVTPHNHQDEGDCCPLMPVQPCLTRTYSVQCTLYVYTCTCMRHCVGNTLIQCNMTVDHTSKCFFCTVASLLATLGVIMLASALSSISDNSIRSSRPLEENFWRSSTFHAKVEVFAEYSSLDFFSAI